MKIAVASDGNTLESNVGEKLGLSRYIIIIDTDTLDYRCFALHGRGERSGVPLEAISIALDQGCDVIIAGYVSPRILQPLKSRGVEVISGARGRVRDVVDAYRRGRLEDRGRKETGSIRDKKRRGRDVFFAFKKTARQFFSVLPVLLGVIFAIGLFQTFIDRKVLFSVFSGRPLLDTFLGACVGSILVGNPVNSYVIGDMLTKMGVSLYAVTALMVTWVTVGLIQLPAEISILGAKFAIKRTVSCFFLAIVIAMATVFVMRLFR